MIRALLTACLALASAPPGVHPDPQQAATAARGDPAPPDPPPRADPDAELLKDLDLLQELDLLDHLELFDDGR